MNPFVRVDGGLRNLNLISDAELDDTGNVYIVMANGGRHKTAFTSLDEFQLFFNGSMQKFMTEAANVGVEVSKAFMKDLDPDDWS